MFNGFMFRFHHSDLNPSVRVKNKVNSKGVLGIVIFLHNFISLHSVAILPFLSDGGEYGIIINLLRNYYGVNNMHKENKKTNINPSAGGKNPQNEKFTKIS